MAGKRVATCSHGTVIQHCNPCPPATPNHHRPTWNSLEIHSSLSQSFQRGYLCVCVQGCGRVKDYALLLLQPFLPLQGHSAPGFGTKRGYSGAQLKICIAASCCQTRCTQANKNIHLSVLISFHPHSLSLVFITCPRGAPFCTVVRVIKACEWKRLLFDPMIVLINGATHAGLCGVIWQAQIQIENSSCRVSHKPVVWAIAALMDAYLLFKEAPQKDPDIFFLYSSSTGLHSLCMNDPDH